jgi:hypothetical protein
MIEIECILFCISKSTEKLPGTEIGLLSDSIKLIFMLPKDHVLLNCTCMDIVMSLAPLLGKIGVGAKEDVKRFTDYVFEMF